MKKMFLDPEQTLHTCKEKSCRGCEISGILNCHFNGRQLAIFLLLCLPPVLLSGYAVFTFNVWVFIGWLGFMFSWFGFWEIRVMCSHCPHYAEPELKALKCWANYGSPKIWKYRPGPMSFWETTVFYLGFAVILFPAIVILFVQGKFILAAAYSVILILWKLALGQFYCRKCMNFACPFNRVGQSDRENFFSHNPLVRDAWKKPQENKG